MEYAESAGNLSRSEGISSQGSSNNFQSLQLDGPSKQMNESGECFHNGSQVGEPESNMATIFLSAANQQKLTSLNRRMRMGTPNSNIDSVEFGFHGNETKGNNIGTRKNFTSSNPITESDNSLFPESRSYKADHDNADTGRLRTNQDDLNALNSCASAMKEERSDIPADISRPCNNGNPAVGTIGSNAVNEINNGNSQKRNLDDPESQPESTKRLKTKSEVNANESPQKSDHNSFSSDNSENPTTSTAEDENSTEVTSDVDEDLSDYLNKAKAGLLCVEADSENQTMRIAIADIGEGRCESPNTDRMEQRKSRKQNMPKRIVREDGLPGPVDGVPAPTGDQPARSETDGPIIQTSQNEFIDPSVSECKNEKSRKRYTPKRIMNEGDLVGTSSNPKEQSMDSSTEYQQGLTDSSYNFADNLVECPPGFSIENQFQTDPNEFDFSVFDPKGLSPHTRGLSSLPWSDGIPQPPNTVSGMTHSGLPLLADVADMQSIADENKNLMIMKRLREIRFHRYRKISIYEKKQIAAYAKLHGVSASAGYFGVSKSAVSLWTRTDFKDEDVEDYKRKRNSFLGNEEFEALSARVKAQKAHKFKGLTKEDKQEVVKYAKLIGVREMARCIDVALGTVSGWMRQFPIQQPSPTPDEQQAELKKTMDESSCPNDTSQSQCVPNTTESLSPIQGTIKTEKEEEKQSSPAMASFAPSPSTSTPKHQHIMDRVIKTEPVEDAPSPLSLPPPPPRVFGLSRFTALNNGNLSGRCLRSRQKENRSSQNKQAEPLAKDMSIDQIKNMVTTAANIKVGSARKEPKEAKVKVSFKSPGKRSRGKGSVEEGNLSGCKKAKKATDENSQDMERLLAESYANLDLDKCFSELKVQIEGTTLEDDAYFETLFKRVTETRLVKYKGLKASEKLEVVRYAKRLGVRRIAKLLDLATGTLSGWITKYQLHLGLKANIDDLDSSLDESKNNSKIKSPKGIKAPVPEESPSSSQFEPGQETPTTPVNEKKSPPSSAILDNGERAEVTALKFLLKDQFPILKKKIEVARQLKFKNVTHSDKLEIVKCAKLVGIRPTARVFDFPLGTLSGWISKYQQFLGYAFQDEMKNGYQFADTSAQEQPEPSPLESINYQSSVFQASHDEEAALLAEQYLQANSYQALNFVPVANDSLSE